MKKKRIFLSSFKSDILYLLIAWIIIHILAWLHYTHLKIFSFDMLTVTFSITLLLSLILSKIGVNKNNTYFGLPFINSYIKEGDYYEFKPGGLNIVIRSLYFIVAMLLLLSNMQFRQLGADWFGVIYAILIIGFGVISYLSNKNDFLNINSNCISWYDNEQKEKISVEWHLINKYSVINYSSDKGNIRYPEKIVFHSSDKEFSLNMKTMSMLPYSQIIIELLESRISVKD
jgi:hypothetical protein